MGLSKGADCPRKFGMIALADMSGGVLIGLLLVAAFYDIKSRRIPNCLVGAGLATGLLLQSLHPDGFGLAGAGGGALIGLAAFLPLYLLRAMAAGDVKLMAMAGAFLGPTGALGAVLGTFLAGGVLALGFAWKAGVMRRMLHNIQFLFFSSVAKLYSGSLPHLDDMPETAARLPYAVAILAGTLGYLVWRQLAG